MCPWQGNTNPEQQGLHQGEEGHRGHASQHLLKLLRVGSHEGLKSLICQRTSGHTTEGEEEEEEVQCWHGWTDSRVSWVCDIHSVLGNEEWKRMNGIGSGFTVKEHGLMGISVICCNQQWSAVCSHCGTSNKSFSFKPLAKGQQMPSARKQKREPLTLLSCTSTLIYLFRIRDATSTSESLPFFLCCLGGVRACHEPRVGL